MMLELGLKTKASSIPPLVNGLSASGIPEKTAI